jgi:hypothetical protein
MRDIFIVTFTIGFVTIILFMVTILFIREKKKKGFNISNWYIVGLSILIILCMAIPIVINRILH